MSQQPSYAPPVGKKWIKSCLGLGPWTLVDDLEFPAPPDGYRYTIDFWTAKKMLVATTGPGIVLGDYPNVIKIPANPPVNRAQTENYGTPASPIYYRGAVPDYGLNVLDRGDGTVSPQLRQEGLFSRYRPYRDDEPAIF